MLIAAAALALLASCAATGENTGQGPNGDRRLGCDCPTGRCSPTGTGGLQLSLWSGAQSRYLCDTFDTSGGSVTAHAGGQPVRRSPAQAVAWPRPTASSISATIARILSRKAGRSSKITRVPLTKNPQIITSWKGIPTSVVVANTILPGRAARQCGAPDHDRHGVCLNRSGPSALVRSGRLRPDMTSAAMFGTGAWKSSTERHTFMLRLRFPWLTLLVLVA